MISAVSDWNRRTILSGEASLCCVWAERNDLMRCRPGMKMTVLQVPEPGVDVAALQQLFVRADVIHGAAFQNEDVVGHDQRRQAMRDDDQRPPLRDAQQIG